MDRSSLLLVFLLLLSLCSSTVHARKFLIFSNGGGSVRGWLALNVETDRESMQEHGHFPASFRLSLPRRPFLMFRRQPHRIQKVPKVAISNGVSQSFMCDTCLDISTYAEQVLADPETLNNVLEYINGSVCEVLPQFQKECSGLAETYVPEAVEMLQVYVAPDKLCGGTKLCPSSSMLLFNDARTCTMCTDFATEALTYLKDNKTETEVLRALHSQCSKLGEFKARCDLLVDAYAPLYIKEVDAVTPYQLCQKAGICRNPSSEGANHCAACEFAVYEMKAKLRNPEVQEKMMEMLLDGCAKVPNHVDQCKEIVTEYGPFILANIDTLVDPNTVCTKIHACDASPATRHTPAVREEVMKAINPTTDLLIQLPVGHGQAVNQ